MLYVKINFGWIKFLREKDKYFKFLDEYIEDYFYGFGVWKYFIKKIIENVRVKEYINKIKYSKFKIFCLWRNIIGKLEKIFVIYIVDNRLVFIIILKIFVKE